MVVTQIVRVVTDAISQGCGENGHKQPKRAEPEETHFLRTIFLLARTPFPAAELFISHFGADRQQAAWAYLACRKLGAQCVSIHAAFLRRCDKRQFAKRPPSRTCFNPRSVFKTLLRGSAVSDVVFFGKFDAMSRATTERSAA
jgi:hypothetical protein